MCAIKIILLISFSLCECANILGIIPTPSYSHQIAYVNLWKELSLKGHNVTVLTTNPQNNANFVNLTEIDLSIGYQFLEQHHNWSATNVQEDPIYYVHLMLLMIYELTDIYLNLPDVQQLINDQKLHFDVVMVESVFQEFLIFGERFNAPTIMLSSLEAGISLHRIFQNDHHPIVYPETFLPQVGELSFKERLISIVSSWILDYIRSQYTARRESILDKHFGNTSLPLKILVEKSSMLFISDIQTFLDSARKGAIYFSLGSNARSENLNKNTILEIIDVFKQLPYSVLWKFDNIDEYKMPINIMTATWLPQQDVLRHPNVKLFITQGGIQSLEEGIYFEKPMVGFPIFSDQFSNTKKLQLKGVLKVVFSKPTLNASVLREAIMEVIGNKSYAANLKKLKDVNMDQPMSGIEKGIWWTEYIIRHKGNVEHMIHNPARTIPFYQYYLLDIFSFLLILLIFISGLLYLIFVILFRIRFKVFRNNRLDRKKEN